MELHLAKLNLAKKFYLFTPHVQGHRYDVTQGLVWKDHLQGVDKLHADQERATEKVCKATLVRGCYYENCQGGGQIQNDAVKFPAPAEQNHYNEHFLQKIIKSLLVNCAAGATFLAFFIKKSQIYGIYLKIFGKGAENFRGFKWWRGCGALGRR